MYNRAIEDWYYKVICRTEPNWRKRVQLERLTKLKEILTWNQLTRNERSFIRYIIKEFRILICGTPEELQKIIKKAHQCGLKKLREKLTEKIKSALSYNSFKTHLGKEIVLKSGVKVCPYCQMQYTLITTNNSKHIFEYDHFFPQSIYPYFSISLYNLIPSCGNCNRIKKDDDKVIPYYRHPYLGNTFFDQFEYIIDRKNIILEYLRGNRDLIIGIKKKKTLSYKEVKALDAYTAKFSITGLMNRHVDLADDLIKRKLYYSTSKKKELVRIWGRKLFKNQEEVERFIVGNYTNPKDHLKRPLAKFQTDIAKQLNLI